MQNEPNLACRLGPRRAKGAKRTQFPAGRDTPAFHYSIIPSFQPQVCRAKQSQFPCTGGNGGGPARLPVPLGQSVRNKANSTRAVRGTNTLWKKSYDEPDLPRAPAKQSQFPDGPRWAKAGRAASAASGTSCTNKPNLPMGRKMGTGRRSHRQSRRGSVAANKPNLPRSNGRRVRGKAAGAAATGDKRAKRSQIAPHRPEKALAGRTGRDCRRSGRSCKTKPICPGSTGRGAAAGAARAAGAGDRRAKRSQFVPEQWEG